MIKNNCMIWEQITWDQRSRIVSKIKIKENKQLRVVVKNAIV